MALDRSELEKLEFFCKCPKKQCNKKNTFCINCPACRILQGAPFEGDWEKVEEKWAPEERRRDGIAARDAKNNTKIEIAKIEAKGKVREAKQARKGQQGGLLSRLRGGGS